MAKSRKQLSKRTRFEIFKRDGFRCVYCGATPIASALHVDHVQAVVDGGANDQTNLVTSCDNCNMGKGPVPLWKKRYPPPIASEAQKDHAEQIREYLDVHRQIEAARFEASMVLQGYWEERMGLMSREMFSRLPKLMREWRIEQIQAAIEITAAKMGTPGNEYDARDAINQQKYFYGILRRWQADSANGLSVERAEDLIEPPRYGSAQYFTWLKRRVLAGKNGGNDGED